MSKLRHSGAVTSIRLPSQSDHYLPDLNCQLVFAPISGMCLSCALDRTQLKSPPQTMSIPNLSLIQSALGRNSFFTGGEYTFSRPTSFPSTVPCVRTYQPAGLCLYLEQYPLSAAYIATLLKRKNRNSTYMAWCLKNE